MAQRAPFQIKVHSQLQNYDISEADIADGTALSFPSNKFICVRKKMGSTWRFVVLDLERSSKKILDCPSFAVSASMNPKTGVIAMKGGKNLQIFDIDMRVSIQAIKLENNISYCKWISINKLVVITDESVYHWSLEGRSKLITKFKLSPVLKNYQITNYQIDDKEKWALVNAVQAQDHKFVGMTLLCDIPKNNCRCIEGQLAAFASLKFGNNHEPSNLLIVASCLQTRGKLFIQEIGDPCDSNEPFKTIDLYFQYVDPNDFPMCLQISEKYGLIYLITKHSYLHICDIQSATCIYTNKLTDANMIAAVLDLSTQGILTADNYGQMLSVSLDTNEVIPYIVNEIQNPTLAKKLAFRWNLSGAEELFMEEFKRLFDNGEYLDAVKMAVSAPKGILRTPETIQKLQQFIPKSTTALAYYFNMLLSQGRLNCYESLALSKRLVQTGKTKALEDWLQQDKLEFSEELADTIRPVNLLTALSIYIKVGAPQKAMECFLKMEKDTLAQYDDKVLTLCSSNNMFESLASYLMRRCSFELWTKVLSHENEWRQQLIDQLLSVIHVRQHETDEVTVTIKALVAANLSNEVISIIEKLITENLEYTENESLQNLLILTAMKVRHPRLMYFITTLQCFNFIDIAAIATRNRFQAEAFAILKKVNDKVGAILVLIKNEPSLSYAYQFAEFCQTPAVWSSLGNAQLESHMINEAIDSFIKAKDSSAYDKVVAKARGPGSHQHLQRYMRMAELNAFDSLRNNLFDGLNTRN